MAVFPISISIKSALSPKGSLLSLLVDAESQTGQHSPCGVTTLLQEVTSSHCISSQRTWPLSHTQIRHGSGFQMSLLVYTWPSAVQLTSSPAANPGQRNTQSVEFQALANGVLSDFLCLLKACQIHMFFIRIAARHPPDSLVIKCSYLSDVIF